MRDIFTNIYQQGLWDEGSGPGSCEAATRIYRKYLSKFLLDHNIKSVVDLGCGDWQSSRFINWGSIDYCGFDVVDYAVETNNKKYQNKNINFFTLNNVKDMPPADLLIVKDVLQHWGNKSIIEFIPILERYKYSLITNNLNLSPINADISIGGCCAVDLSKEPFNLPVKKVLEYEVIFSSKQRRWFFKIIPYKFLVKRAKLLGRIVEKKAVFLYCSKS